LNVAPPLRQLDIDDLAEARAEATRACNANKAKENSRLSEAVTYAKAAAAWSATVPGRLRGLAGMSRAEWAVMLSGFWVAIKKEAHHFWVRRERPSERRAFGRRRCAHS
jgi:hypothetical protein